MCARRIILGMLLMATAACDESLASLPQPTTVTVAASAMSLMVGGEAPVAAQVLDQDGELIEGLVPVFSTDNPAVATVGTDGLVRGLGPGTAGVTAAYGTASATVRVTVTPNQLGEVQSLRLMADSLLADVRGGVQAVAVQAFNGVGQPVCPQLFIRSSHPSVATARAGDACRVEVVPVFPGEAIITAAAGGHSDSVRVRVTNAGEIAFFSNGPGPAALIAGNTVSYSVRALDQTSRPIANQPVLFAVSVGTASPATAMTDSSGTATVQWALPTDLRAWGQTHSISFRTRLPSGATVWVTETVYVDGASLAEIILYSAPGHGNRDLVRVDADSLVAAANGYVTLGASAVDQYGNARATTFAFSAVGASWYWGCSATVGQSLPSGIRYTCLYGYPTPVTFTATAGNGRQRSLRILFRQ